MGDPEEVLREAVTLAFHGTAMWARDKRHAAFAALDQLLQERDELIESNKIWQEVAAECVEAAGVAALVHVPARIRELEAERDARRDVAVELSKDLTDEAVEVARLGAELDEARASIQRLLADGCETGMAYCEDSGCFWCGELRPFLQKDIPHRPDCAYVAALAAYPVEEPAPKPAMPDPEGRWTWIQAVIRERGLCGELVYGEEGPAVCLLEPAHAPAHPVGEGRDDE